MPRRKLTDEERAERKKNAWNPNQFKKRTTNGSASQWAAAARALLQDGATTSELFEVLGISAMPSTVAELQKARRKAMRTAHPDAGGSEEKAQAVNEAYEELLKLME